MSISRKAFSVLQRDLFLFVTNLITGIVVARKLGPSTLGIWVVLQLVPTYAEAFGRPKTDVASIYFLGRGTYKLPEIVAALNVIALSTATVYIGVVLWRADWVINLLFHSAGRDVRWYLYMMLPQIPLLFVYMNYAYLHIALENVAAFNAMSILRSIISSGIGIALLTFTSLGLWAVVLASTLSLLVACIYGVVRLGRVGAWMVPSRRVLADLFSYSSKLYAAGIASHVNAYTSQLITVIYLAPTQVAFLGMAQSQSGLLTKAPDALSMILLPRIVKAESATDAASLAALGFRVMLILLGAAGIVACLLIRPAVAILYGRAYLPAVTAFWIMIPGVVVSSAVISLLNYFQGIGRADLAPKIALVPVVLQVGSALLLIPWIGLVGAAIAVTTGMVAMTIATVIVFLRLSGTTIRGDLIPGRAEARLVVRLGLRVVGGYVSRVRGRAIAGQPNG